MSTVHVPAWKRLGLKLKQAKDVDVTSSDSRAITNGHSSGTKTGSTVTSAEPPNKKRRLSGDHQTNGHPQPRKSERASPQSTSKPKKRVSFSSDTKLVDGDTAQSALPSEAAELFKQSTTARPIASKSKSQRNTPSTKSKDSLEYLTQFSIDQKSWKFNKNREIWILKHALSETDIPPSYNLALAQYINGLKSTNARTRLKTECLDALAQAGPDTREHPEPFRELVSTQQLRNFLTQNGLDDELNPQSVENVGRPALLLLALHPEGYDKDGNERENAPGTKTRKSNDKPARTSKAPPVQKKRKNRTAVVEFSSSSSESSSSDDEDEKTTSIPPSNGIQHHTAGGDDTSSSGEDTDGS